MGDDYYNANTTQGSVTVEVPITVKVNGTGNSSQVLVDLPGNGTVNATIDGVPVNVTIVNGTAIVNLTNITPGEHNLTITYTDENGTVSVVNTTITVPRWDSEVSATAPTIRQGDVLPVTVKVGSSDMKGNVVVTVNGTSYLAEVSDGEVVVNVPALGAAVHEVEVKYLGSDKYDPSEYKFNVTVQAPITVDVNGSGNSSQVVIELPENHTGSVEVLIDNKPVDFTVVNDTVVANLTGLEPSVHNLTVIYTDEDGTQSVVNTTINVPKWDSSVSASAAKIREGDDASIVVKVGNSEMTGRVLVDINGTGYYADMTNGEVTITAPGLKAGTYSANVTYEGNNKYDPSNNTFTVVVEAPIVINIDGSGNSSQVVINLPENGTDDVVVTIDGNPVPVDVNNRTAVANLTGLEPGEHNITVVYTDENGNPSVVNTTITVPRWDSVVSATAPTIRQGDDEVVTVEVGNSNMTGLVFVDIAGTGYYANITDGKVNIIAPGLKAGKYVANVTYLGNSKYDPSNNTFTFVVKAPRVIDTTGAGNSTQVVVDLPENGTENVTILVDGVPVPATIKDGKAVADLNNIAPGEHNVTVIYTDKDGQQSVASKMITVYNSIKAADMTRGWDSPYDFEAEFLDKDGHVIANTVMKFKVNGKTYSVKTDSKGIAKLTSSHLAVGKYTVEIINTVTGEVVKKSVTIVKRLSEGCKNTMTSLSHG